MSTHTFIDKICCVAIVLALIVTIVFMNGERLGIQAASIAAGYESRLFDTSSVHTIDIVMDDWEGFLEGCTDEEYVLCDLVIDNEAYKNVAIRAKGNTSLTQVANYGNDRYSFKIEFDHYDSTKSYYGLDKLSLNNIIQDNTYMKDYLSYQMMGYFGVDAPLCSYVYITVNGENWGLYLAVEGVEEAFLQRNYGSDYGELYKPDSQSMGGGRGNGGQFDMEDWQQEQNQDTTFSPWNSSPSSEIPEEWAPPDTGELPEQPGTVQGQEEPETLSATADGGRFRGDRDTASEEAGQIPQKDMGNRGDNVMGSSDVSLIYTDDDYDSYSNIFGNAKTNITDADKDRLIDSLQQLNEGINIEDVVNVDEVIRYFVVHNFVCNFDSYTGFMIHNYYLYEEDGQLSMIPWDYNLAFGGFQGAQDATALVNYPIDTPVSGGTVESRPMLAWIFASEEYTQLYHQYFAEFIASYFDSGYFAQMIDSVQELIAPYVEQDPTKFCTYEEFETGVATLKEFCLLRAESISGQLAGTIPATSDGQSQDSSTLIDASDLNISDMGTMNNSDGMVMDGFRGDSSSENQDLASGDTEETNASDNGTDISDKPESTSELPSEQESLPEQSVPERPANSDTSAEQSTTEPSGEIPQGTPPASQSPTENRPVGQPPEIATDNTKGAFPSGDASAVATNVTQKASAWLPLIASAVVLAAGLAIAAVYKKRG